MEKEQLTKEQEAAWNAGYDLFYSKEPLPTERYNRIAKSFGQYEPSFHAGFNWADENHDWNDDDCLYGDGDY